MPPRICHMQILHSEKRTCWNLFCGKRRKTNKKPEDCLLQISLTFLWIQSNPKLGMSPIATVTIGSYWHVSGEVFESLHGWKTSPLSRLKVNNRDNLLTMLNRSGLHYASRLTAWGSLSQMATLVRVFGLCFVKTNIHDNLGLLQWLVLIHS